VYVREALECVQYLSRWFQRTQGNAYPEIGWADAVRALKNSEGAPTVEPPAFTVMGDWANGLLTPELDGDEPIVMTQEFPGTQGLFVYTSDTFPLPDGVRNAAEAEEFLRTIASPRAQVEFSKKKGSIPSLAGNDGELKAWQQRAGKAFDDETTAHLLAISGYFPPYYPQEDFQDALIAMTEWDVVGPRGAQALRAQRVDEALRLFTDSEPLLKLWQARLSEGVPDAGLR
jgi:hypothetical protein